MKKCVYCGKLAETWDHVIPRSKNKNDAWSNLVPCCTQCNTIAGSRVFKDLPGKKRWIRAQLKVRTNRIMNMQILLSIHRMILEMVNLLGQRQVAKILHCNPGIINHIVHSKWFSVSIYPDLANMIKIAHSIVMRNNQQIANRRMITTEKLDQLSKKFSSESKRTLHALRKL